MPLFGCSECKFDYNIYIYIYIYINYHCFGYGSHYTQSRDTITLEYNLQGRIKTHTINREYGASGWITLSPGKIKRVVAKHITHILE